MKYANIAITAYKTYVANINEGLKLTMVYYLIPELVQIITEYLILSECDHFSLVIKMSPKICRFVWFAEIINTHYENRDHFFNQNDLPTVHVFSQQTVVQFNAYIMGLQDFVKSIAQSYGKTIRVRNAACVAFDYYQNANKIKLF